MKIVPELQKFLSKICLAAFVCAALATAATAQIKLRNAMDYDGDGKADVAVWRPTNNVWYIQKSGGGFLFQAFGRSIDDVPTPGDYDGDNKGDIAVYRDTDGAFYLLRSSNNTFVGQRWGTAGDEPVARDYDGDGKTDFAVVRRTQTSSVNQMSWYILGSNTSEFIGRQFGQATDFPAPGDYDGDGKWDLAVQRGDVTTNGPASFFIEQSTNRQFVAVNWGLINDFFAPGDYDGDGKTDIAVVREQPPTLNWYIRRSSNQQLMGRAFGASQTDMLVQNDYDGDGKTDIAVWRDNNTTGTFYIDGSTSGFFGIQWGATGDFPVASYDSH